MLASNIPWKPVRLEIERQGPNRFAVSRGDEPKGTVFFTKKRGWSIYRHLDARCIRKVSSFRTGVLQLCRQQMLYPSSNDIQDYGLMRVRRVEISTTWFTILTDPKNVHHTQIFLDFPREIQKPNERMQALLYKALHAVNKHE